MTDFERLVLEKIDDVHARVNGVHERLDEFSTIITQNDTELHRLLDNGQPGEITKIKNKLQEHEALINQHKGFKTALWGGAAVIGGAVSAVAQRLLKGH